MAHNRCAMGNSRGQADDQSPACVPDRATAPWGRYSMLTVLVFGATLSACGNGGTSGNDSSSSVKSTDSPTTAGLFRLAHDAPKSRRTAVRAARAGRDACQRKSPARLLSSSLVASKGLPSDVGTRRHLARIAHRLPSRARHGNAGASIGAALYALRFPPALRAPARAGCLSALHQPERTQ